MYNYKEEVKTDIKEYLNEMDQNDWEELAKKTDAEIESELYDRLFVEDCITGNGSGSYTFNTETAAEYLANNMDLLLSACDEFGDTLNNFTTEMIDGAIFNYDAADVTIRCYLLPECLQEVLPEYLEKIEEEREEEEEEDPDPYALPSYFAYDSEQEDENREMLEGLE